MNRQEFLLGLSPELRAAATRAADWRLLSLLMERPHDDWHRRLKSLASEIQDPELAGVAAIAQSANEEVYLHFLGPGAMISPREVAYAGYEDPGRLLADLQSFYAAFAFTPGAEDPADHISVETGFVGYLLLKEAFAIVSENEEAIHVTRVARERFLEEHLVRLIRGMENKLEALGLGPAYLVRALELMKVRVAHVKQLIPVVSDPAEDVACGVEGTDCGSL